MNTLENSVDLGDLIRSIKRIYPFIRGAFSSFQLAPVPILMAFHRGEGKIRVLVISRQACDKYRDLLRHL